MNRRTLVVVLLGVGVVATVAITSALLGVGPVSGLVGGEESQPPALLSFESAGAQCTDDFIANSSTTVSSSGSNTHVTHAQNISLPDPSYAVGGPTFERRNDTTYVLSIPTEETEKTSRGCTGFARYEATMRVPAGDDPWQIIVRHDDETAITLFGDSDSSGAGGSASAGGEVSD